MYQSFNLLEALTALENGALVMELLRQNVLETNKAVVILSHDHPIRDIADRGVQSENGRLQAES